MFAAKVSCWLAALGCLLAHAGAADQTPLQPAKSKPIDKLPPIGLGLWNSVGENATNAVRYAFNAGYHHLDGAAAYDNEEYEGAALTDLRAKYPRNTYWITSKLWNSHHRPALVPEALNTTLSKLNTSYVDLYLMHWPVAFLPPDKSKGRTIIDQDTDIVTTWQAMEELVRANLTRHIGVSNFSPRQLDTILARCSICPTFHEFETHPYLQQQDFVDWHAKNNITVIAYSPLGNMNPTYGGKYKDLPPLLDDSFWKGLAKAKNVSTAQAVLGWGMQRGTVVIPKSVHKARIIENLGAQNVKFSEEEMKLIAEQDKRSRFNNPSTSWGVELFEGLDDGSSRFMIDEL